MMNMYMERLILEIWREKGKVGKIEQFNFYLI